LSGRPVSRDTPVCSGPRQFSHPRTSANAAPAAVTTLTARAAMTTPAAALLRGDFRIICFENFMLA
jgi:hypothetical protein